MLSFCRRDELEQQQSPLRKRLEELQMELAQQVQLLTVTDVALHARPTALEQKQKSSRPLRNKWVGGSLGVKSGNARQQVTSSVSHVMPTSFHVYL